MADELIVRRVITAPTASIFAALANPQVHAAIDSSGMITEALDPTPLVGVGDTFTMQMYQPELGEYVTENTVFVYQVDVEIGWLPNREGSRCMGPAGCGDWRLFPKTAPVSPRYMTGQELRIQPFAAVLGSRL